MINNRDRLVVSRSLSLSLSVDIYIYVTIYDSRMLRWLAGGWRRKEFISKPANHLSCDRTRKTSLFVKNYKKIIYKMCDDEDSVDFCMYMT